MPFTRPREISPGIAIAYVISDLYGFDFFTVTFWYTGDESSPTILPGTDTLNPDSTFADFNAGSEPLTGQLSITAIPEPASAALLLLGAIGMQLLRRLHRVR